MTRFQAEVLLAGCLGLRGSSLLFSKTAMETISPMTLIGCRFLIAFVFMAVIFRNKLKNMNKREVMHSISIGVLLFFMMVFELEGLKTTPSSTTAFIENGAVVIVPFLSALIGHTGLKKNDLLSAFIVMCGIGFLTLKKEGFVLTTGELLVLGCAFCFALSIVLTDRFTQKDDPYVVGVIELLVVGLCGMISAFIFEPHAVPSGAREWGSILYLALVCSGVGFTLQPLAQKYTTAERTSLLGAFNPLTASVLGIIFLGERMNFANIIGAVLVLLGISWSAIAGHFAKNDSLK